LPANFRTGLQPYIDSGNLGALILKNSYQTGLHLPKLGSDRAVNCVDDDFPQPQICDARLTRKRCGRLEDALEPKQASCVSRKPGEAGIGGQVVFEAAWAAARRWHG